MNQGPSENVRWAFRAFHPVSDQRNSMPVCLTRRESRLLYSQGMRCLRKRLVTARAPVPKLGNATLEGS